MMPETCLFCQIISGQSPARLVYQTEHVTAIRDLHPQAPTHILLLPNRHITSMAHVQPADQETLGALLAAAAQVAEQEGLAAGGYRLVINTGRHGGQSVNHLHVHLLGGRALRWPPG